MLTAVWNAAASPVFEEMRRRVREIPAFGFPMTDADGNIWIGEYGVALNFRAPPRFEIVTPEGVWLGGVDVPPGFQVLAIGRGRLVGAYPYAEDRWEIAMYALER